MTNRATKFASTSSAAITPPPRPHVDDIAVDALAAQQKARLAEKRDQGFNGWDDPRRCSVEKLAMLMAQSMCKGKVVDVANFAAMLHSRGAAPELIGEHAMRSLLRGAREHRASVASQLRAIIADDSYAFAFQTMAQYRTALLKTFDSVATTEEPTPQACAHCGGSGRQEDVFEQASAARCHINLEGLAAKLLAPRAIVRDEEGYLVHPDLPAADEGTRYDLLLEAFGLETAFVSMETDCKDEALLDRYFGDGDSDCSGWTPTPPAGDGWTLLEIYPTEDGPYAMFARRKPAQRPLTRRQRRDAARQADPLRDAVDAMVRMLEDGEWAEHVATTTGKGDALAHRLETAITDLHNQMCDTAEQAATGAQKLTDERVFEIAEQYGWTRKGDAGQWIVCHTNAAANLPALIRAILAQSAPSALSAAARDVLAERQRQIEVEGWTPEHDDQHDMGQLGSAAGCYAMFTLAYPEGDPSPHWPWDKSWWKPSRDRRRNLEKAGALVIAEIERLDRAALAASKEGA